MITDAILLVIFGPIHLLLSALPNVTISSSIDSYISSFASLLGSLNDILPITEAFHILIIFVGIKSFSLTWNIILRIKSFIPTMGN